VLYIFIDEPLLVLPTQVLHSIAMMSLLVVGVLYVDWLLQPKWRASGQALYTAALHGVGPSVGLYVSGLIYQGAGITPVWLMSAVIATLGTIVFAMVLQRSPVPQMQQEAVS
jgi:PPP family 3-phenylpropionic acid transporter